MTTESKKSAIEKCVAEIVDRGAQSARLTRMQMLMADAVVDDKSDEQIKDINMLVQCLGSALVDATRNHYKLESLFMKFWAELMAATSGKTVEEIQAEQAEKREPNEVDKQIEEILRSAGLSMEKL